MVSFIQLHPACSYFSCLIATSKHWICPFSIFKPMSTLLSSAVDKPQQHKIFPWRNLSKPGIKPGPLGWKQVCFPLCYAAFLLLERTTASSRSTRRPSSWRAASGRSRTRWSSTWRTSGTGPWNPWSNRGGRSVMRKHFHFQTLHGGNPMKKITSWYFTRL